MTKNLYGALFMTLSMFGYASTDAFIKFIGLILPLSEILILRGVVAVFLLFLLTYIRNEFFIKIKNDQYKYLFLRIFGDIGCTILFLTALINMKIANATAILQCLPLALTFCAALFLKERVGWRRWSAIIIGFFGVLIPGILGNCSRHLSIVINVPSVLRGALFSGGAVPFVAQLSKASSILLKNIDV